jgi:hypothetical protein
MTITSLSYEAPVRRSTKRETLDYEKLELSSNLADEGRPLEALVKVFEHFFPDRPAPDFAKDVFTFDQGSSRVTTKIEDDHVVISVPLVRLPAGGGAVAALRTILTRISSTGQLYQPRLRGDDVYLEYKDRLSRFHPAKVVEVLRRMPSEADDNDDFLIGQFSAQPLHRVPIAPLDPSELARCEAIWRRHWNDVDELLKECQRKRSVWFLNEVTAYAFYRVRFALPLCGFLSCGLDESAGIFNDSDEEPLKREASLAKCVKAMLAVSGDDLAKSLGHATYAISPLEEGTPQRLGMIGPGNYMQTIDSLRSSGKPLDAALALVGSYNFLLARYFWDEPIETALKDGLGRASGKPWREAAALLFDDAKELFAKYGKSDDEEDDDDDDEEDDDEQEEQVEEEEDAQ